MLAASPVRLVAANIQTNDVELSGSALRAPAQLSPIVFHFDRGAVTLAPVTATFSDPGNLLRIDASSKSAGRDSAGYHVAGSVQQVRDLVTAASLLGWHISRGWDVAGPARIDLHWPAEGWPWKSEPSGTIDFGGDFAGELSATSPNVDAGRDATLLAPFINQPVRAIKAHVDVRPDYRRITLASADAFGARWTGTLERRDTTPGWEFALSADHVATADVDRWLNPRWRQSLLVRVLPFLGTSAPSASPEDLYAQGRIVIDQLTVAPLVARHVQGELKLNGREIDFTNATAQIASGSLSGTLKAALAAVPSYQLNMNFANVDLGDLSAVAPSIANQFDGPATGEITLASRGASRSDLAAALSCDGTLRAAPLQLKNLNLDQTLRQTELRATPESFHEATATFTCSDSTVDISRLTLTSPTERIDATGSVDFSRQLDLTLKSNAIPGAAFQLTGPLASLSIKKIATPKP
jgi:AsmA-like protein